MTNENSSAATAEMEDNSGRTMGLLSMAAAPGAILISPSLFALLSFFLALMGLTVSTPQQRIFSFGGIALAIVCGGIGYFFKTPLF